MTSELDHFEVYETESTTISVKLVLEDCKYNSWTDLSTEESSILKAYYISMFT